MRDVLDQLKARQKGWFSSGDSAVVVAAIAEIERLRGLVAARVVNGPPATPIRRAG